MNEPKIVEFPELCFSAAYYQHLKLISCGSGKLGFDGIGREWSLEDGFENLAWDIESSRCPAFLRKAFGLLK